MEYSSEHHDMQLRVILFDETFPAWEESGGQVGVDSEGEFMISAGVVTEIMKSLVKSTESANFEFGSGVVWTVDILSKTIMAAHDRVMPVTTERLFNE